LPWSGQIGAFLLVAIALFVVFRIYYIGPQRDAQAQKQVELEQKLAEVEQAQQDAIELAEFQAEVDDLNNRLEALSAVLPGGGRRVAAAPPDLCVAVEPDHSGLSATGGDHA
ncbi:MAG: hypothetical protein QF786_14255, partial [Vicinamibacterales bacterium]|nr:hypothetical protein [Vicinamibacterales bacterium]